MYFQSQYTVLKISSIPYPDQYFFAPSAQKGTGREKIFPYFRSYINLVPLSSCDINTSTKVVPTFTFFFPKLYFRPLLYAAKATPQTRFPNNRYFCSFLLSPMNYKKLPFSCPNQFSDSMNVLQVRMYIEIFGTLESAC